VEKKEERGSEIVSGRARKPVYAYVRERGVMSFILFALFWSIRHHHHHHHYQNASDHASTMFALESRYSTLTATACIAVATNYTEANTSSTDDPHHQWSHPRPLQPFLVRYPFALLPFA